MIHYKIIWLKLHIFYKIKYQKKYIYSFNTELTKNNLTLLIGTQIISGDNILY